MQEVRAELQREDASSSPRILEMAVIFSSIHIQMLDPEGIAGRGF